MEFPKISIITPSFNQGKFLEETIHSVISQDYPNLEYIVIDGGSTDESKDIIRKYENKITFHVSEQDRGQSHAINKGFEKATGEIVSWLCSDDLYVPGALLKVAACFNHNPDAAMIHGKTILFGKDKPDLLKGADQENLLLTYFAVIPFAQPSSFFRKKVIDEQGFLDEQLHFGMDYDLLIRTALNYKIEKSEEVFSKYRLHEDSKTIRQQRHFPNEWAMIFSKFLRTVDFQKKWTPYLEKIQLYHPGTSTYHSSKQFTEAELKLIFLYFLEYQLHVYYDLLDLKTSKAIALLIETIDKTFFKKRQLAKIQQRAAYLNPFLIKLLRKFSR